MSGLHIVANKRRDPWRWYVYAWRSGPCIHVHDGAAAPVIGPDILDRAAAARHERAAAPAGTLEWLAGEYRASPEFDRLAPRTKVDYRHWLDRIGAEFGRVALSSFEDRRMRAAIMQWRDGWAAQPRTADKGIAVLKTLLAWAVTRGLLAINVAAGIPHLYRANRSEQVWTDEDWAAIEGTSLDPATGARKPCASPELLRALRVASLTGLRLGDLVALQWQQVGPKAIAVMTAKSLHRRRAVIPILPPLAALLEQIEPDREKRKGAVLTSSRGTAWTTDGLGTAFQRAKQRAGIDKRIHDLRGTFVTWLARHRLTNEEIARIVGWSPRAVEAIRSRYVDEAQVITSLAERLAAG